MLEGEGVSEREEDSIQSKDVSLQHGVEPLCLVREEPLGALIPQSLGSQKTTENTQYFRILTCRFWTPFRTIGHSVEKTDCLFGRSGGKQIGPSAVWVYDNHRIITIGPLVVQVVKQIGP